ncbi:hypothetical protein AM493_02095 [Flavobacterium akiainvivens]|uniref:Fido domain-containing protein n=1 Tax=Flavobacterium akiainvivens TaxID=1202724 RepID=A0A0M8M7G1_9FLAO|nr:Fic family protein [Flavobacterium akiainvivens]KOS04963.1 hypothetical protein AM493_02095 [Flavobacterium akiainvivens]SFQ41391.1 cell filamentation protein [Flavobacterium akiainvivens]
MDNNTNYTSGPEENLLGITDISKINEIEAEGIAKAEIRMFEIDILANITVDTILELHKAAFQVLYGWAGKWRKISVQAGQLQLPEPHRIPNLMYQFLDNLNYKINIVKSRQDHIDCIVFAHYQFVIIHPFNNGNGRLGRILMNLVALKLGYYPLDFYSRDGESRTVYINALKQADIGDFKELNNLVDNELRIL